MMEVPIWVMVALVLAILFPLAGSVILLQQALQHQREKRAPEGVVIPRLPDLVIGDRVWFGSHLYAVSLWMDRGSGKRLPQYVFTMVDPDDWPTEVPKKT